MSRGAGIWMFGAAVLLAGCRSSHQPKLLPPGPQEVRQVRCADVTAHFVGETPADSSEAPEYGIDRLWFELPGSSAEHRFTPGGSLSFSDWNFEVFAPDCAHVLLPQDRYGPFHVVHRLKLGDYLARRVQPKAVLEVESDHALVHCKARWLSGVKLEVTACGETELVQQYIVR